MKKIVVFLLVIISLNTHSQTNDTLGVDVDKIISQFDKLDSNYSSPCYYVDLTGKHHPYQKLLRHKNKIYTIDLDKNYSTLDVYWSSIGYYTVKDDTAIYHQALQYKLGEAIPKEQHIKSFVMQYFLKEIYWLGVEIPQKKIEDSPSKKKAQIWNDKSDDFVAFSDSLGQSLIIIDVIEPTSAPGLPGYNGMNNMVSTPVYSDIPRHYDVGGYCQLNFISNGAFRTLRNNLLGFDKNKQLDEQASRIYTLILSTLSTNEELKNFFMNEFQIALDDAYKLAFGDDAKLIKADYVDIGPLILKLKDEYVSKHMVIHTFNEQ